MRHTIGQGQERIPAHAAANGSTTVKEIPYDYVATFTLEGRRGNRVQDVINISVDGTFVAVAIGYSFIPARLPTLPEDEVETVKGLLDSFFEPVGGNVSHVLADPRQLFQCLLVKWCGIHFKYTIIDSAAGRELQNQPIHNIAGLGEATGDRPFRPLAKPMRFAPRSTIRVEVQELMEAPFIGYDNGSGQRVGAELYIVLHGYKILGYGG